MRTILKGIQLFNSDSGEFLPKRGVVVQDGKVESVLSEPHPENEGDAVIFDFQNRAFVLPGLIDCHVKIQLRGGNLPADVEKPGIADESDETTLARIIANSLRTVGQGITTVKEGDVAKYAPLAEARRIMASDELPGPTLLSSGRRLVKEGWQDSPYRDAYQDIEGLKRLVNRQVKEGVDFLELHVTDGIGNLIRTLDGKVGDEEIAPLRMTGEELKLIAELAANHEKRMIAHAHRNVGECVRAGVKIILHGCLLDAEDTRVMADNDVGLIPTLQVFFRRFESGRYSDSEKSRQYRRFFNLHVQSVERALAAGVKIGLGSGSGLEGVDHNGLIGEMEIMKAWGFMDGPSLLKTATAGNADLLGQSDRGAIEPGKVADILVVAGNPARDLSTLKTPLAVFRNGLLLPQFRDSMLKYSETA